MATLHSILIVEDDSNDLELTQEGLASSKLENDVTVVRDGASALDFLYLRNEYAGREPGNPAVILLDLKLPKVSGHEVLKTLKHDENLRMIPVVVLSSSNQHRDLVDAYENGVNAYVVKPVDYKKYIKTIRNLAGFWALLNEPPPGSIRKHRE